MSLGDMLKSFSDEAFVQNIFQNIVIKIMEMFLIHFLFLFDKVSSVLDKLLKKRTSPVGGINITISQNSFKFLPQHPLDRLRKRCILSVQEKICKEVERTKTKFSSLLMIKAKILRQTFLRSLPRLSFETQIFETETETFSETDFPYLYAKMS